MLVYEIVVCNLRINFIIGDGDVVVIIIYYLSNVSKIGVSCSMVLKGVREFNSCLVIISCVVEKVILFIL